MSLASGWVYAWSSPALAKLNGLDNSELNPLSRPITTLESSWMTSLLHFGATFGPIVAGVMADRFGRKRTLLIFSLPMIIGNIITIFANAVEQFYVARFLCGLGCGAIYAVMPLYVSEISEPHNRGFLSCLLTVLLTFSSFVCYGIGPYVSITVLGYLGLVPLVFFVVIFSGFIPESPFYYVLKSDLVSATRALQLLRRKSVNSVEKELEDIKRDINREVSSTSFFDIFKTPNSRRSLFITLGLMMFQQASGISGILAYLQIFFDATGSSVPSDISVMIVGFVQFASTFLTSVLVDKLGRKILILISCCGLFISLSGLGIYFFMKNNGYNVDYLFWAPVFFVMLYSLSFSIGIGPLPWTILSEILPADVKFYSSSLVTWVALFSGFSVTMLFPILQEILGMTTCMWMFAGFIGTSIFFVIFFVPETKGKTFDEIQAMLVKKDKNVI